MASIVKRNKRARQQQRTQSLRQYARLAAFAVIVVAVIVAVVYFLAPALTPQPSGIAQDENAKTVNIQAAMDGFDIKEVRAKVGEKITVNLRSLDNEHHTDGGGKHQFAIDELGVNIIAQPLSANAATFTPDKPGAYTFYCDICCGGKANPTMSGKLIVES